MDSFDFLKISHFGSGSISKRRHLVSHRQAILQQKRGKVELKNLRRKIEKNEIATNAVALFAKKIEGPSTDDGNGTRLKNILKRHLSAGLQIRHLYAGLKMRHLSRGIHTSTETAFFSADFFSFPILLSSLPPLWGPYPIRVILFHWPSTSITVTPP